MPEITKQNHKQVKKSGSAVDRIGPIEFEDQGISLLLYGRSGTGKTVLWSSFPGPILAIICSGGINTGELRSVAPADRKKISQIVLSSIQDCKEVLEHAAETGKYRTIVLDHASGLQDLAIKEVLGLEELPAQKSWGLATQQDWGQATLQCKEVCRSLLNLKGDKVIVGQERESEPQAGAEIVLPHVGVGVTKSFAAWLNSSCDYIGQTFIRAKMVKKTVKIGEKQQTVVERGTGVEYCLRTEPHDVYQTKFRAPKGHVLPDAIVNPDYNKIMEVIRGK